MVIFEASLGDFIRIFLSVSVIWRYFLHTLYVLSNLLYTLNVDTQAFVLLSVIV